MNLFARDREKGSTATSNSLSSVCSALDMLKYWPFIDSTRHFNSSAHCMTITSITRPTFAEPVTAGEPIDLRIQECGEQERHQRAGRCCLTTTAMSNRISTLVMCWYHQMSMICRKHFMQKCHQWLQQSVTAGQGQFLTVRYTCSWPVKRDWPRQLLRRFIARRKYDFDYC